MLVIQAEKELAGLATRLGFDFPLAELPLSSDHPEPEDLSPEHPGADPSPKPPADDVVELRTALCKDASDVHNEEARHAAWMNIAYLFHRWDMKVQDTLAPASAIEAGAYQLGRGLAEAYWSLDPKLDDAGVRSWFALIGPDRCGALQRLMVQLTATYGDRTTAAVRASLVAWRELAVSSSRRVHPSAVNMLHDQLKNWHMLLVEGVDPHSFITARGLLATKGSTGRTIGAFGPAAAFGVLALAAVIGAILALTMFKSSGVVLAVLAVFGITAANLDVLGALDARPQSRHDHYRTIRLVFYEITVMMKVRESRSVVRRRGYYRGQLSRNQRPVNAVCLGKPTSRVVLFRPLAAQLSRRLHNGGGSSIVSHSRYFYDFCCTC